MADACAVDLPRTRSSIERGIGLRWHRGVQVAAYVAGVGEANLCGGEADDGIPLTDHHLLPLFCAAKPLLALAVARLAADSSLDFCDRVADVVPEFGCNGKEEVRICDVLRHTVGFPFDPLVGLARDTSWDAALAAVCAAPVAPIDVGTLGAYQLYSYWYVLGEILRRSTGEAVGDHLRRAVLGPLGMTLTSIGAPDGAQFGGGTVVRCYDAAAGLAPLAMTEAADPNGVMSPVGAVADLVRMYRCVLDGSIAEVVPRPVMDVLTSPQRVGSNDATWGAPIDFGYGFMIESRRYGRPSQRFGQFSSDRTFGHWGGSTVVAFADPTVGLAAGFAANGWMDGVGGFLRVQAIVAAIYRDLGLAPDGPPR